jgi:uncharacterized protein
MSRNDRDRIVALTAKYGGEWVVQHAQRLIRLVEMIGKGLNYNAEVIWLAAHIHDWGTLPRWSRPGIPHSVRSKQLAEHHLGKLKCSAEVVAGVLEAIEFHHGGADERCAEAILLRDADALDGLGVIGVLREFASIPTEESGCYTLPVGWGMRGAVERARIRLENNPRMLRLPRSIRLARQRARSMQQLISRFEAESFGMV